MRIPIGGRPNGYRQHALTRQLAFPDSARGACVHPPANVPCRKPEARGSRNIRRQGGRSAHAIGRVKVEKAAPRVRSAERCRAICIRRALVHAGWGAAR